MLRKLSASVLSLGIAFLGVPLPGWAENEIATQDGLVESSTISITQPAESSLNPFVASLGIVENNLGVVDSPLAEAPPAVEGEAPVKDAILQVFFTETMDEAEEDTEFVSLQLGNTTTSFNVPTNPTIGSRVRLIVSGPNEPLGTLEVDHFEIVERTQARLGGNSTIRLLYMVLTNGTRSIVTPSAQFEVYPVAIARMPAARFHIELESGPFGRIVFYTDSPATQNRRVRGSLTGGRLWVDIRGFND